MPIANYENNANGKQFIYILNVKIVLLIDFFKNKQDLFCVKSKKLNCAKIYDVAHIFLIFVR